MERRELGKVRVGVVHIRPPLCLPQDLEMLAGFARLAEQEVGVGFVRV
jgi:hypothetical protein